MPKKFTTENTKSVAAKARKEDKKDEEQTRKQKEADEAFWKDDDKKIAKKQQKKEGEEQKRQLQLQKKAEAKELLEKEMTNLATTSKKPAQPTNKLTRAQIEKAREKAEAKAAEEAAAGTTASSKLVIPEELPLEENINRLDIDIDAARTVDEAIAILVSDADPGTDGDSHPERRMRAAYAAYLERRLVELKQEHPSLRLSQLKQMIFKDWQRAPENPMRNKE